MSARDGAESSDVTCATASSVRAVGRSRCSIRDTSSPEAPDGRGARYAAKKALHLCNVAAMCFASAKGESLKESLSYR